jgi:hypothetical protein
MNRDPFDPTLWLPIACVVILGAAAIAYLCEFTLTVMGASR